MWQERREHDRRTQTIDAACRIRGIAYRARLLDVSKLGCRAEVAHTHVAPGDRVLLQLSGMMVLPATVAWVDDRRLGLRFASPLHGAMLAQYASRKVPITS